MLTFELAKLLRMMLRVKNVVACMGVWVYGCMGVWVDGMMALKTAAVSHSPIHPSTHPQNFPRIIYGQLILLFLLPVFLSAGPKGFSGYWHSTFGHIQIEVSGKRATGVYNDGEVEGRLEGRISADGTLLNGKWSEGDLSGLLVFRLAPGSNGFNGYWWKADSEQNGHWAAVRVLKGIECAAVADDYAGSWETNFGVMELQVAEGNVTGTFQGRVSSGRVSGAIDAAGNRFSANWSDEKYRGTMVLQMQKGKNSFYGEWRFADGQFGGIWYGVKKHAVLGCISGDCAGGEGTYVWRDGSRFEGQWQRNNFHGIGTSYDAAGSVDRSGVWANGLYQGRLLSGDAAAGSAKLELPDGRIYEGELRDYDMNGSAVITYPNGDVYQGEVLGGVPHGRGSYRRAGSGEAQEGRFKHGVLAGTERPGYLVYRLESQLSTDPASGQKTEEVYVDYLQVETSEAVSPETLLSQLNQDGGIQATAQYQVEHSAAPLSRLRRIINRFRFNLHETRLHIRGGTLQLSDSIAMSRN